MMLVKTRIGPSNIHGIGLFADQFIKAGTPVWKFQPGLDLMYTEEELSFLSDDARNTWNIHRFFWDEKHQVLCGDNGRFENHSDNPNVRWDTNTDLCVAIRDIEAGEELTENYKLFQNGRGQESFLK